MLLYLPRSQSTAVLFPSHTGTTGRMLSTGDLSVTAVQPHDAGALVHDDAVVLVPAPAALVVEDDERGGQPLRHPARRRPSEDAEQAEAAGEGSWHAAAIFARPRPRGLARSVLSPGVPARSGPEKSSAPIWAPCGAPRASQERRQTSVLALLFERRRTGGGRPERESAAGDRAPPSPRWLRLPGLFHLGAALLFGTNPRGFCEPASVL